MKGTKLGLLGVCFGLTGIAIATNNDAAFILAFLGVVMAVAGLFVKD